MEGCVFCDLANLRVADVYFANEHCVYASTRDPRDPADVLPGSGILVPIAHRASPFDFTAEEWSAAHELLLKAKAAWDERLAPDGYFLSWSPSPFPQGRPAIKVPENRRPDPLRPGGGRAKLFGRPPSRRSISSDPGSR